MDGAPVRGQCGQDMTNVYHTGRRCSADKMAERLAV